MKINEILKPALFWLRLLKINSQKNLQQYTDLIYGVAFTRPALFAGLCALLTTLDLLEHHDLDELKRLLRKTIGEGVV